MTNRKLISCAAVLLGLVLTAPGLWAQDYQEAPALAAMVDAGTLPPVQERLPAEPLVIEPVEEIGQYGGTWEKLISSAGQTALMTIYSYDRLLRWNPDATAIEPNIATSYEVTDGGKTFVFHLREGMKWSDGHPFTADDFVFWYEDMLLNEELTPSFPTWLMAGGEPVVIEKIDDYTVRFRFAAPYGLLPEYLSYFNLPFRPKHYLQQFHPAYADQDDLDKLIKEEGVEHWYQLFQNKDQWYRKFNPDLPVVEPWVVITPQPATRVVLERNPYYWKTDPAGNQLPYIDRVALTLVEDTETINFKTIAGEADMQSNRLAVSNFTLFMENRDAGDYRVLVWPRDLGSHIGIMPNLNVNDEVLGKILQDSRFRKALSLSIDRDEINELVYLEQGIPRQATVISGSPLFKEEYASAYAEYDPASANALLDEMGLTERDGDGFRLRPDGDTLALTINIPEGVTDDLDAMEIITENWRTIGVKAAYKPLERSLFRERVYSGEAEVGTWLLDRSQYPFEPIWFIPTSQHTYWAPKYGTYYASGGTSGEKPPAELQRLVDIWEEIKVTTDTDRKNALFQEVLDAHQENVWIIGVVGETPQLVVVKNNFRNVPEKSLYAWSVGHYLGLARIEQFFFKQ